MKRQFLSLGLLSLCCLTLHGQEKPLPPGRRELQDYQAKHADVPPQVSSSRLNTADLQREAADLAELARSVPADVDSINKGVLPKDAINKLKRIEKISRHLRGEISP